MLRDARSSNGTWHGAARLEGPSPLGEDELLRFGDRPGPRSQPCRFHAFLTGLRAAT